MPYNNGIEDIAETTRRVIMPDVGRETMKRLLALTFCVYLCGYSLRAAEPAIVHGYGATAWGQSRSEVAKLISLKEGSSLNGDTLTVEGDEPVSSVTYMFFDDRLHAVDVRIVFSEMIGTERIRKEIERIINKKYHADAQVASSLKEAGIGVFVASPIEGHSTNLIATIVYHNSVLLEELKQKREQRLEEESRAAFHGMGLEDLL